MNPLANEIIGYIILVGIILSYIPQYVKIVRNKSSLGISELYLVIGYLSSTTSWNNGFIFYYPIWESCKGFYQCNDETLGFIQLVVQWLSMLVFYILYLKFHDSKIEPLSWFLFIGSQVVLVGVFATTYILSAKYLESSSGEINLRPVVADRFADVLAVFTVVATCIQYLPQIYKTFRLKSPENLSLITLSIQCPGTFAWAIYLALQKGEDVSTWIPYVVAATSQLVLLIMGTIFLRCRKYNGYSPIIIN
jgi:cystinosin